MTLISCMVGAHGLLQLLKIGWQGPAFEHLPKAEHCIPNTLLPDTLWQHMCAGVRCML